MESLFGGKYSDEYNAVYTAILGCGEDHIKSFGGDSVPYSWLENTPKTSMTAELVDKLHELGFKIVRKKNE